MDRLEGSSARLRRFMEYRLQEIEQRLDLSRLVQAIRNLQAARQQDLRRLAEKLHLLSPLATLSRGYSIVWSVRQGQDGTTEKLVLKNAADVKAADKLEIAIQNGKVYAQVERSEA